MQERIDNILYTFGVSPSVNFPSINENTIECSQIIQGFKQRFGVGRTPINKNEPNRRSYALKAIGEKGNRAVCILPKMDVLEDSSTRIRESKLFQLANELQIEEVPILFGEGHVDYDPIDGIFNTKEPRNNRPYQLVEDVSEYADKKMYYDLTTAEKIDYSLAELDALVRMSQQMSLSYKDFDDEIWIGKKTHQSIVKFIDFSEEKSLGTPLTRDVIMRLAKDYLSVINPTPDVNQKHIVQDMQLAAQSIEIYANLLKKYHQLDEKEYDRIKYPLEKDNIERYLKVLRKNNSIKMSSSDWYFRSEYERSMNAFVKFVDNHVAFDFDDSMELFFQRRVNGILKSLRIYNIEKTKEKIISTLETFNEVVDREKAVDYVHKFYEGWDKAPLAEIVLLYLIDNDGRIKASREDRTDNTLKGNLERLSTKSEIHRHESMLKLILSTAKDFIN